MTASHRTIAVRAGDAAYDVLVGPGLIDAAGGLLAPRLRRRFAPIITDTGAGGAWAARLGGSLEQAGIAAPALVLPAGEATKDWHHLAQVADWLLAEGTQRSDIVIALGGGVVGDLAGFAAAILKRGCRIVQMPTTLLAQVDSSVGGKTGINTAAGKNMVGAFHQPDLVLADIDAPSTLPPRELRAGYAEVVKYGLIDDAAFFAWCEAHGPAVIAGDPDARAHAVSRSITAKARVVAADPTERRDIRALLNLGHTFGHALEAERGYDGGLLHGEAVATGMALAFGFAVSIGQCPASDAARVSAHLRAMGLPVTLADAGIDASGAKLAAHMAHDKKASDTGVPFILPDGIGRSRVVRGIALDDVAAFLDGAAARVGASIAG